jgi:peroxiredoxin Q/BCP
MARPIVGETSPAFTLQTGDGTTISSSDYTGNKAIVLYFYPKDDTPGCTREACDFRDLEAEFAAAGAVIFGVSKDSEASHAKFSGKFSLNFPLLSDPDGAACEAFGVWVEKMNYGKKYMGIERTTFVIGKDGAIKAVFPKVKVDGHAAKVLTAVKDAE